MDSPLLTRPGAVPAPGADAGVAWHYGDPLGEQRRLVAAEAVVDMSHRDVLELRGPDRHKLLDGLASQKLDDLAAGDVREALVLSPTGHVEHHLVAHEMTDVTVLHTEPGRGDALGAFLTAMRFLLDVQVAAARDTWAVMGGLRWLLRRRDELAATDEPLAGMWAREALRVAAGVPRLGLDTDDATIPHEVGWIGSAVHLSKGCYRGQETVARVHNLGRPPRRLVLLHLDGSADTLPRTGDAVEHDGASVGRVGTVAQHFELGPVALAVVRRALPLDVPLIAGGVAAAQEVVVDPEVGDQAARAARDAFRARRTG